MTIALLILAHWIAANFIALVSLVLSLTPFRGNIVSLFFAVLAVLYGLFLTINQGIPRDGLALIYFLSWIPLLVGGFSLFQWCREKRRSKYAPNPS